MNKEKALLGKMLATNKISIDDYSLLTAALDKKLSSANSFSLINPFQKIAGWRALAIGLVIMVLMSFLGVFANVYFDGILASTFASGFKNAKITPNFLFLIYENLLAWLCLTLFYIAAAKICKQKRIRIVDFFGTVALSRFPFLILVSTQAILALVKPNIFHYDPAKNYEFHFSFLILFNLFWTFCYTWQIATYFFALKEASGLTGRKLWISFLISMLFCEMIGIIMTRMFL